MSTQSVSLERTKAQPVARRGARIRRVPAAIH